MVPFTHPLHHLSNTALQVINCNFQANQTHVGGQGAMQQQSNTEGHVLCSPRDMRGHKSTLTSASAKGETFWELMIQLMLFCLRMTLLIASGQCPKNSLTKRRRSPCCSSSPGSLRNSGEHFWPPGGWLQTDRGDITGGAGGEGSGFKAPSAFFHALFHRLMDLWSGSRVT